MEEKLYENMVEKELYIGAFLCKECGNTKSR